MHDVKRYCLQPALTTKFSGCDEVNPINLISKQSTQYICMARYGEPTKKSDT